METLLGRPESGIFLITCRVLRVGHVQRVVSLVAGVDPGAIGGRRDPMGRLDARDLAHDGVRDRVNDVDPVPGGIALEDPNLAGALGRQRQRQEQRSPEASDSAEQFVIVRSSQKTGQCIPLRCDSLASAPKHPDTQSRASYKPSLTEAWRTSLAARAGQLDHLLV